MREIPYKRWHVAGWNIYLCLDIPRLLYLIACAKREGRWHSPMFCLWPTKQWDVVRNQRVWMIYLAPWLYARKEPCMGDLSGYAWWTFSLWQNAGAEGVKLGPLTIYTYWVKDVEIRAWTWWCGREHVYLKLVRE